MTLQDKETVLENKFDDKALDIRHLTSKEMSAIYQAMEEYASQEKIKYAIEILESIHSLSEPFTIADKLIEKQLSELSSLQKQLDNDRT